ncbi:MAG TPA: DUF3105 domain-containing protein [Acidimicrobiales bacterium]|nr:DUF3105 domain-containing protein [Acidimicrobiales bacterium]
MRRVLTGLVAAALCAVPAAGCSAGGGTAGGCTGPRHEALDIRSTIHLLPGAPEPPYSTDPPTSGAHRVGYYPSGVNAAAIARPTQVALLEKGFVIVQYRSAPAAAALAPLAAASPYVAVAPDPTLPNAVVATSWLYDLRCASAAPGAVAAISRFIGQRVGHGPEPTIPLSETVPGGVTTTTAG